MAGLTEKVMSEEHLQRLGLSKQDLEKRRLGRAMVTLMKWRQEHGNRELGETERYDVYNEDFPFTVENVRVMNYAWDFLRREEALLEQARQKLESLIPQMDKRGWTMRLLQDDVYVKVCVGTQRVLVGCLKPTVVNVAEILGCLAMSDEELDTYSCLPFQPSMGKPEDFPELAELVKTQNDIDEERAIILYNMLRLSEDYGYEVSLESLDELTYKVCGSEASCHVRKIGSMAFETAVNFLAELREARERLMVNAEARLVLCKMLDLVPKIVQNSVSYRWSASWSHAGWCSDAVSEYGRSVVVNWRKNLQRQYDFCEEDYQRLVVDLETMPVQLKKYACWCAEMKKLLNDECYQSLQQSCMKVAFGFKSIDLTDKMRLTVAWELVGVEEAAEKVVREAVENGLEEIRVLTLMAEKIPMGRHGMKKLKMEFECGQSGLDALRKLLDGLLRIQGHIELLIRQEKVGGLSDEK